MRIHHLDHQVENGVCRASAIVTWEDCERPEREVYVETDARYAEGLWPNPNGFVLATVVQAMRHGERRLQVEGSVCPQLRNGVETALGQLRQWYGPTGHQDVTIEPTRGFAPATRRQGRVASFMSGGVDAMTTLFCNRADFPLDHPGAIRDSFLVHGIDVGGYDGLESNREHFSRAVQAMAGLASEVDLNLIPLSTNFRHLDDDDALFALEAHGAIFSGIAHMFSRRITKALLASSCDLEGLIPWGSHPLLDPNYSSSEVQFEHDGARLSRLQKMRLVVDQEVAMRHLRSCYYAFRPGHVLNCGKCEKCIRTATEFIALGKFDRCRTFPMDDVSPEMILGLQVDPDKLGPDPDSIRKSPPVLIAAVNADHWRQLGDPLRAAGRHDLADAAATKVKAFERYRARVEGRGWRGMLKRFDRRFLNGLLARAGRSIKSRQSPDPGRRSDSACSNRDRDRGVRSGCVRDSSEAP